jgi:hypothetical protein
VPMRKKKESYTYLYQPANHLGQACWHIPDIPDARYESL